MTPTAIRPVSDEFSFGDSDLLGDIEPPREASVLVHKGPSKEAALAHEAWSLWAATTARPDAGSIDRKFMHAYLEQIRAHRSHAYLLDVVRGAACLPIKANNANDTRRVINALKNPNTGRTAVSALKAALPVIPYPSADEAPLKCSIVDIVDACRIPASEWTERDQDAAGIITEHLTPAQVDAAAEAASLALGMDGVLPTDILRAHRSAGRTSVSSSGPARSTYSAGVTDRARLKGVEFSLDDTANRMFLAGARDDEILRVHTAVPDGYWDAVFAMVVEGDSNEDAYRRLADRFGGFHPDERL